MKGLQCCLCWSQTISNFINHFQLFGLNKSRKISLFELKHESKNVKKKCCLKTKTTVFPISKILFSEYFFFRYKTKIKIIVFRLETKNAVLLIFRLKSKNHFSFFLKRVLNLFRFQKYQNDYKNHFVSFWNQNDFKTKNDRFENRF